MSAPLAAIDLEGPVTDGFRTVATFVPKLLGFLLILLVGYLVAKVVAGIVDKVLERVGFDRAVERGGIKKALAKSQYDASDIVAKIAFYFIFVAALSMAFSTLDIAALEQPMAQLLALLPKILVALVIFVIGATLAAAAKGFLSNVLGGLSYGGTLATVVAGIILVMFGKAALDEVGIATTVTNALLYTVLATIAGVTIVGVGGGLIAPMSKRWDGILDKGQAETRRVKEQTAQNPYPADPMAPPAAYAGTAETDPRTRTMRTPR
jgi:Conserved TM helix